MSHQTHAIYQSGQQVLADGWYEVVAAQMPIISQLTAGMNFPNYDGRAICWHLLPVESRYAEKKNTEPEFTDISEDDLAYGGMYS